MNYVGKRTAPPTTGWTRIQKFQPLGMNLLKHYTGWGPLSKVPAYLTATHLEKEIDSHTGKISVKVPLTTTEKLGLAIGELLVGSGRALSVASFFVVSPICNMTGMQNSVCKTARIVSELEWWTLGGGWELLKEGVNNIKPLANKGFEATRMGMTHPHTYIITHLGLLGSGGYLINSAIKDYKTSPLSVSRFGKITLTRQSNTLGANAKKIATIVLKGTVGTLLIGTSLAFMTGFMRPADLSVDPEGGIPTPPAA